MQNERRYWFPRYGEAGKFTVDLHEARVICNDPEFVATIPELTTLMLCMSGHSYEGIASILGRSKSSVFNDMYDLRKANKMCHAELYSTANEIGVLNSLALRGLAAKLTDSKRRDVILSQIDAAAQILNQDLQEKSGKIPLILVPQPVAFNAPQLVQFSFSVSQEV